MQEMQAAMAGGGGGRGMPGAGIAQEDIAAIEQQLAAVQARVAANGGQVDEETLRAMHPLEALLRSMLPWVNAGEQPAPEGAAEEH